MTRKCKTTGSCGGEPSQGPCKNLHTPRQEIHRKNQFKKPTRGKVMEGGGARYCTHRTWIAFVKKKRAKIQEGGSWKKKKKGNPEGSKVWHIKARGVGEGESRVGSGKKEKGSQQHIKELMEPWEWEKGEKKKV